MFKIKPEPEQLLEIAKKWWLSLILIPLSWFIIKQFWLAIGTDILFAVNYNHVFGFKLLYLIIDSLTLLIHEAGHTLFGFFGFRMLTILGGTFMQLLIPLLIFVFALFNKKQFIAQLSLYWLGFSWLDTAAYCADAKLMRMPLFGNLPKSAHDFHNILSYYHLLESYAVIAYILYFIGTAVLILAIIWPIFKREELETAHLKLEL